MLAVGKDVVFSTVILSVIELQRSWVCLISVILGISEPLGVRLPLGVVGVNAERHKQSNKKNNTNNPKNKSTIDLSISLLGIYS